MAKVTYASLKLKVNSETKKFTFGEDNKEIEVLQYLPISNKIDLVDITLQKAQEDVLYNPIKVDMYFHLHIVYLYTNLVFTDKQKEDEEKLYDVMVSSGLLDQIISNMNEDEYNDIWNKINERMKSELTYNTTAAAVIRGLITDLPTQAQAAMDIVNSFDPNKFEAVKAFAEAANGNRNINTNEPVNLTN